MWSQRFALIEYELGPLIDGRVAKTFRVPTLSEGLAYEAASAYHCRQSWIFYYSWQYYQIERKITFAAALQGVLS